MVVFSEQQIVAVCNNGNSISVHIINYILLVTFGIIESPHPYQFLNSEEKSILMNIKKNLATPIAKYIKSDNKQVRTNCFFS